MKKNDSLCIQFFSSSILQLNQILKIISYFIMSMNCVNHIETSLLPILANSGRNFFRVGRYQSCLASPSMNYNFVVVAPPGYEVGPYFGLCLPDSCSKQAITEGVNYVMKKLQISLQVSIINNDIQSHEYEYSWVFFLTFFLLSLFFLFFLLSSFVESLKVHPFFGAFSIQNSSKIFSYKPNKLNVLNGIRSLAMLWVLMGHQYTVPFQYMVNIATAGQYLETYFFLFIEGGFLAVDVFFFLGGFFTVYTIFRMKISNKIFPLAILNRYMRLIPVYLITVLIFYSMMMHFGSGPLWVSNLKMVDDCDGMWRTFLFVDNLVNNGQTMCLGWGWYLQNDMQIFIFCIFLLWAFNYNKKVGYSLMTASIFSSLIYTAISCYNHGYRHPVTMVDLSKYNEYFLNLYIKPWVRCPPYIFGLILGIFYSQFCEYQKSPIQNPPFLEKVRRKLQKHRIKRYALQLFGLLLCIFIVIIPRMIQENWNSWSEATHALYLSFSKMVFILGLTFFILPSLIGIQSIVIFSLDTKFFSFMAKISFCIYLVHEILMYQFYSSQKTQYYYHVKPVTSLFSAHTLMSIVLGYLMVIMIELPCSVLQKSAMQRLKGNK